MFVGWWVPLYGVKVHDFPYEATIYLPLIVTFIPPPPRDTE